MAAVIAIIVCTYLAGVLAAYGGINARGADETPARTVWLLAGCSWLAFGYLACGGTLESEEPPSETGTIKLSSGDGSSPSPWDV
jgi:hypothetical protein